MPADPRALLVHLTYYGGNPPETVHFRVTEYARIGTDCTIQVLYRVFSGSLGLQSDRDITLFEMEQRALGRILPDNAEETGETQEWNAIQQKLHSYDVKVAIEDLKNAPVVVEIEPHLLRMVDEFTQSSRR